MRDLVLDLPNFCLTKDKGSSLHLKRDHVYYLVYYQCQLQLYATQRLYDFVVWTEANLHIERIIKDELFLKEIIPPAEKFSSCVCYLNFLASGLPEAKAVK